MSTLNDDSLTSKGIGPWKNDCVRGTASDGITEIFNIPGYPLLVSAVSFNRLHGQYLKLQEKLEELEKKVSGT